jgi:hypothetical protein
MGATAALPRHPATFGGHEGGSSLLVSDSPAQLQPSPTPWMSQSALLTRCAVVASYERASKQGHAVI